MCEALLPERVLQGINARSPGLWREVDQLRSMRGREVPEWSKNVFLPLNLWRVLLFKDGIPEDRRWDDAAYLQACCMVAAWRPSQDVVIFDPDLYRNLLETPIGENLPCEILWRLPAWSVYVEMRGVELEGGKLEGFFAMLDEDKDERALLIFFLDQDCRGFLERIPIGDWTLLEAMRIKEKSGKEFTLDSNCYRVPKTNFQITHALECALTLLLFICAYGLATESNSGASHSSYPTPKRVKNGWRLFPPNKPNVHELGKEFGESLRRMNTSRHSTMDGRKSPRPHLRRAHWHGFWSGPKKDPEKRRFDLTWLPPIPVAMVEDGEATHNPSGVAV